MRELAELIEKRGGEVRFAIHPVAGRMPGHMNVLLAEANVPYDQLYDMDEINGEFDRADVALVIGANDVVNPAARNDKTSPIYGMPILNVDQAKSVIVLKRGMGAGFAGIENELFYCRQTSMLFGDAKASLTGLIGEIKTSSASGWRVTHEVSRPDLQRQPDVGRDAGAGVQCHDARLPLEGGPHMPANGHLIESQMLEDVSTAKSIRVRNGRMVTTDGPFAENKKEVLGGFNLIEARDMDEALEIAKQFPWSASGCIEVRPVRDIDGVRRRVGADVAAD